MATGDSIKSLTAFVSIQAAAAVVNGAYSAGARTTISAAFPTASEKLNPLLDFQLKLSGGAVPTENGEFHLHRRSKADGINESPAPGGNYNPEYVGSFTLDATANSTYYLYSIDNADANATYYLKNVDGSATLTAELLVRTRAYNVSA